MNQRPDVTTKPQPIDEKDQKPIGHGDKLDHAVESAAKGAKPPRSGQNTNGDAIQPME